MITRGFERTIMILVCSTNIKSLNHKRRVLFPLLLRYRHSSKTWSSVSLYLVQSRYRQGYSTRSCVISSSWPTHVLQLGCNLIERAQYIFHHTDEQIPLLAHTPKLIPLEYLRSTFMTTLLWTCGVVVEMMSKKPPMIVDMPSRSKD
jgi:hypothetical protein